MCTEYDLNKVLSGTSGKFYQHIESLHEAVDIFGIENIVKFKDVRYTKLNTTADFEKLLQDNPESCLCPLDTERLLEAGGLKQGIDFKLDYEEWGENLI